MYYFAYGSNMNHKQMKERCPSSKFLRRVYLDDYKFVYDGYSQTRKGSVANIVELKGGIVWGGLFEINEDNLAALDCHEGYPKSYDRKTLRVRNENNSVHKAWVYSRIGQKQGRPSGEYRKTVVRGAKDCNLPEEYIKNLLVV